MSAIDLDKLGAALEAWHNGGPALPIMEAALALLAAARERDELRATDASGRARYEIYKAVAKAKVAALRSKLAQAEKALEPFAETLKYLGPHWGNHEDHWGHSAANMPTVGDLRRAAKVLASIRDSASAEPEGDDQ